MFKTMLSALAAGLLATASQAATVSFNDSELAAGFSISKDGLNVTTSTADGALSTIGSGIYTGLYVGVNDANGTYEMTFSQAISSIEIEFDALSNSGGPVPETIFGFATNNGAVSITYTNQFGTSFDGTTITSTENDGQGIIRFTGAAFTSFFFTHDQDPRQNGFVIERLVVDTVSGEVPLPATGFLLFGGLLGLAGLRRKG